MFYKQVFIDKIYSHYRFFPVLVPPPSPPSIAPQIFLCPFKSAKQCNIFNYSHEQLEVVNQVLKMDRRIRDILFIEVFFVKCADFLFFIFRDSEIQDSKV